MLDKPLLRWSAGAVQYVLRPMPDGRGMLTAIGPGLRFRVGFDELDDATVSEWMAFPDAERTARAEALLAPRGSAGR